MLQDISKDKFYHCSKLISYLSSATRTLDICVYFLTCNIIVQAILALKKKGVAIRVITDEESTGNVASQVPNMEMEGL